MIDIWLFRNREICRSVRAALLLTLLFAGIGLFVSPACALFALAAGGSVTLLHIGTLRARYRVLVRLSQSLDEVLHGNYNITFADYAEGEVAILGDELRKMTCRLREQVDALRTDKEGLTVLLADLSHQLRTPLTSVRLLLSLLAAPNLTTERRGELVGQLTRLFGRMDWLIDVMLKQSKLDAGVVRFRPERVTAVELLRTAAEPILVPIELRRIRLELEPGDAALTCDLRWTAEAVGNLLKNCMEHTPPDGCIRAAAVQTPLYTELTVTDDGPGIEEAELPRIFDRFFSGSQTAGGFGIGLSLARRIVHRQNGVLKAENHNPHGAKFTLRLYHMLSGQNPDGEGSFQDGNAGTDGTAAL